MSALAILFPDAEEAALFVEDGAVVARGAEAVAAAQGEEVRRVLIAPAAETGIHRAPLAGLSIAQARSAARLELADRLLDAEGAHFAPAQPPLVPPQDAVETPPLTAVAVAPVAAMARWIEAFAPHSILPAQLAAPTPEAGYLRTGVGREIVLRGPDGGFVEDETLTPLIVGEAPVVALEGDAAEAALIAAAQAPEIDLMQGPFAPKRVWAVDRVALRWAGYLAAAFLILFALTPIVEIVRLNWSAATIEDTAKARAQAALGEASPPADPIGALDARLSAYRGGGAGFAATSGAVAQALAATPNVVLVSAGFDSAGTMQLSIRATAADELRVVQERLRANGLSVTARPINPSLNPPVADLEVRGL